VDLIREIPLVGMITSRYQRRSWNHSNYRTTGYRARVARDVFRDKGVYPELNGSDVDGHAPLLLISDMNETNLAKKIEIEKLGD
jgi:hypothetical protein